VTVVVIQKRQQAEPRQNAQGRTAAGSAQKQGNGRTNEVTAKRGVPGTSTRRQVQRRRRRQAAAQTQNGRNADPGNGQAARSKRQGRQARGWQAGGRKRRCQEAERRQKRRHQAVTRQETQQATKRYLAESGKRRGGSERKRAGNEAEARGRYPTLGKRYGDSAFKAGRQVQQTK